MLCDLRTIIIVHRDNLLHSVQSVREHIVLMRRLRHAHIKVVEDAAELLPRQSSDLTGSACPRLTDTQPAERMLQSKRQAAYWQGAGCTVLGGKLSDAL